MKAAGSILAAMLLAAPLMEGQETVERPVTSVYTIEAGRSHICDTYLTPLKYDGWQTALSYERWQAMRFNPEKWVMNRRGRLSLDRDLT
ncbi:MAG: hypothetical protein K2F74_03465, partial [Muribaculaceae bacterium]|nr:hypothetical protein [Muribaculaceae bacterium]